MEFIRVEGTKELETALVHAVNAALATNEPTLWLIPGGSNITTAIQVMQRLEQDKLKNLTCILTDERYGKPGHADSNFFQLHQGGFDARGAQFSDLLEGADFKATIAASSKAMEAAFSQASKIIGFFGMGADGHIAGILPNSPAAVDDETWMIGYDGGQFQRFTLTPFALSHVHQAFVGAFGDEKREPLQTLHDTMLPIATQPAQILRHLPEAYIYNNQIGD